MVDALFAPTPARSPCGNPQTDRVGGWAYPDQDRSRRTSTRSSMHARSRSPARHNPAAPCILVASARRGRCRCTAVPARVPGFTASPAAGRQRSGMLAELVLAESVDPGSYKPHTAVRVAVGRSEACDWPGRSTGGCVAMRISLMRSSFCGSKAILDIEGVEGPVVDAGRAPCPVSTPVELDAWPRPDQRRSRLVLIAQIMRTVGMIRHGKAGTRSAARLCPAKDPMEEPPSCARSTSTSTR